MCLRLTQVRGFSRIEIASWVQKHLSPGCIVVSDGLPAFRELARAGCRHQPLVTGGGPDSVKNPQFLWVNTLLGNVKNAIHGTYHAVREKHLPRYLAEFCYQFNRRFQLQDLLPRFMFVALRTPSLPYRLAIWADVHGLSGNKYRSYMRNQNFGGGLFLYCNVFNRLLSFRPKPLSTAHYWILQVSSQLIRRRAAALETSHDFRTSIAKRSNSLVNRRPRASARGTDTCRTP
ncbi:putative transposase [Leptospirillum ferriphilum ML-04]|uniref:Putative transposase n=1 Tax=Leptospirillum ferriphilum (strain ML-04) TaxID=1048260 RepID=J9ZDP3_LEPFM|nr:putative transposase [Leptospirillum ferriphilum ML-04]